MVLRVRGSRLHLRTHKVEKGTTCKHVGGVGTEGPVVEKCPRGNEGGAGYRPTRTVGAAEKTERGAGERSGGHQGAFATQTGHCVGYKAVGGLVLV